MAIDLFRLTLDITFEGEPGLDYGGIKREFFKLLTEALFTEKFGMFRYNEDV